MANITAAFVDGIAALATDFIGINGGVGLALDEVISEIGVIDGGSTKSVDSDDDDVLFEMVAFPSAVTKCFSALFSRDGIVCGCTAVEGGEQDAQGKIAAENFQHVIKMVRDGGGCKVLRRRPNIAASFFFEI